MQIQQGRLVDATQQASPNCDERQDDISLLIVHGISLPPGEFGGPWIDALFTNTLDPDEHEYFKEISHLKVSSHLLIRRDGELLQYVPFDKRAWHAGESLFDGQDCCNDFSIGIELEGTDDLAYTDEQYRQLAKVISTLQAEYPAITAERVVGHSDVAPGRKTDPGPAFDWYKLRKLLSA